MWVTLGRAIGWQIMRDAVFNATAVCDGIRGSFAMIARLRSAEQLLLRLRNFPV
jgi:hypothetical protein